jgi:hypothetical protein
MSYLNRLGPGDYWYVHDQPAVDFLELTATRLDTAAAPIHFRARGWAIGAGLPTDWVPGWYYRTEVGAPEMAGGCWKIALGDDPSSAVIYSTRPDANR